MPTDDKKSGVGQSFETAAEGRAGEQWSETTARKALEAALGALESAATKGELDEAARKAKALCEAALARVPENIKGQAPRQALRPKGPMASAADKVDRKVKEKQDADAARQREKQIETKKKMGTTQASKPVERIRKGGVEATIWAKEAARGPSFSVTLAAQEKNNKGERKPVQHFEFETLLTAQEVIMEAQVKVSELESAAKARARDAKTQTRAQELDDMVAKHGGTSHERSKDREK